MFSSHLIVFALLSFLVGVNASTCATCPATVQYNDGVLELSNSFEEPNNEITECIYKDDNGGQVLCQYGKDDQYVAGYYFCPRQLNKNEDFTTDSHHAERKVVQEVQRAQQWEQPRAGGIRVAAKARSSRSRSMLQRTQDLKSARRIECGLISECQH